MSHQISSILLTGWLSIDWWKVVKVNVQVTLRLAVYSQSVLGVKPLETHDQYFFQLNACGYSPYVISSLTRIWIADNWWVWVWASRYDRRSVGQSLLEWSTHLRLTAGFLLLSDSCGFVDVGRSLWREDGSSVYNCCLPSPAQSFSGLAPVGLATVFYCLRFETSLFVSSYDSQDYGGGIRPLLHTGVTTKSKSKSHCD
jgi:hypothetical protein